MPYFEVMLRQRVTGYVEFPADDPDIRGSEGIVEAPDAETAAVIALSWGTTGEEVLGDVHDVDDARLIGVVEVASVTPLQATVRPDGTVVISWPEPRPSGVKGD